MVSTAPGMHQGAILGPFFLIYINNLSIYLSSTAKHFVVDTFLFPVLNDINLSEFQLVTLKISEWTYQWEMYFNPDISKET